MEKIIRHLELGAVSCMNIIKAFLILNHYNIQHSQAIKAQLFTAEIVAFS